MRSRITTAVVVAIAFATPVLAQEGDEVSIAKGLVARGIYEPADTLLENVKTADGLCLRGRALSGEAGLEKDAGKKKKLVDEATKVLEAAQKAGAKDAAAALANLKNGQFETAAAGRFEAKGEIEFAQKLLFRGMVGAADAVIESLLKQNPTGDDKAFALDLRARIYVARSRAKETPPEKRKEFFEKAKSTYEEILKAASKQEEQFSAREGFYELFVSRANGLSDAVKRETDLSAQETLKKEAVEAWKEAETFFEAESKKWQAEMDKGGNAPADPAPGGDKPAGGDGGEMGGDKSGGDSGGGGGAKRSAAEDAYMLAAYYYPKALVGHATVLGKNDEHDALLKKAIDLYQDYNLRYGQEFIGFEAAIDMGDAYKELGNEDDAINAYQSGLAIEKVYDDDPLHPDPKRHLKLPAAAVEVFARATLKMGRLFMSKRESKKALDAYNRVFFHSAEFAKENLGKQIIIERAEAKAAEGKKQEAIKDLEALQKEDPTGPIGIAARAMLARVSGKRSGGAGDLAGIDMETAIVKGEQALETEDLGTAMSMARLAIILAPGDQKAVKLSPRAFLLLGDVYFRFGRFYEAAIAYEEILKRWPQSGEGPKAGLNEVRCYRTLSTRAPNAYDKEKYEASLKEYTRLFPSEGKGAVQYLLAQSEQEDQNFSKAVEYYEQVKEESGRPFDDSRLLIGVCWYLEAKKQAREKKDPKEIYGKAEKALLDAEKVFGNTSGLPEDRVKARKDLDFEARCLLSDILLTLDRPGDVISQVEKLEESTPDKLARVGYLRILAWVRQGDLAKSEAQLKLMLEKAKDVRRTILATRDVAGLIDRTLSDPKKKDMPAAERADLTKRAAEYYKIWIVDGPAAGETPSGKDAKFVADRLFDMAYEMAGIPEKISYLWQMEKIDGGNGKPVFENAAEIYSKLEEDKSQKEMVKIMAQGGSALAFLGKWKEAAEQIEKAMKEAKLVLPDGDSSRAIPKGGLDRDLLLKHPEWLAWYFNMGRCWIELAQTQPDKILKGPPVQKALDVYANVLANAPDGGESWWRAKWEYFHGLDVRGEPADYETIKVSLRAMERANPNWDNGKFGLKEKFQELQKRVSK